MEQVWSLTSNSDFLSTIHLFFILFLLCCLSSQEEAGVRFCTCPVWCFLSFNVCSFLPFSSPWPTFLPRLPFYLSLHLRWGRRWLDVAPSLDCSPFTSHVSLQGLSLPLVSPSILSQHSAVALSAYCMYARDGTRLTRTGSAGMQHAAEGLNWAWD